MAQDEVIKIDTGQAAKSMADLRKELKETQAELSKTKVGTKEYQEQLEKLGSIKDDIGDLRDVIGSLNPEGKVQAFSNVAGKLAGGFQAATGAAALFGSESKDLEKTLLKVQAATAFAQGIQSVTALGDAFAVVKTVLLSFNPILLGIVAAITAIGVAYKVWSDNMSEAAKNDALLNAELERQKGLQESINADIQRELDLKKALGATNSELNKAELNAEIQKYASIKTRIILLRQLSELNDEQKKEYDELVESLKDSDYRLQTLRLEGNRILREDNKKTSDEAIKNSKAQYDAQIANLKAIRAVTDAGQAAADANNKEVEARDQKAREDELKAAQEQVEARKKAKQDELNAIDKYLQDAQDSEDQRAEKNKEQRSKDIDEMTAKEKAAAEEQAQAKARAVDQGLAASKSLSDAYFNYQLSRAKGNAEEELKIRKKQFEVDKAFSIARAIIDGVRSVQAALTLPPPAGPILAVLNGVLAAANIAKIASTKFDAGSSSSASVSAPSATAPNLSAPTAPVIQPQTKLNEDGTVKKTTDDKRIYVSGAEIMQVTDNTNRIKLQSSY